MNKFLLGAAASTVLIATAAYASVSFDSNTGTGFVGKGDVQTAFGWNNATLQEKATKLTFLYQVNNTYDVQCYWTTATGHGTTIVHDVMVTRKVGVKSKIGYQARVQNQVSGFYLTGFGASTYKGVVPVIGGPCPKKKPGTITGFTNTTTDIGKLYVKFGTTKVQLPWPSA